VPRAKLNVSTKEAGATDQPTKQVNSKMDEKATSAIPAAREGKPAAQEEAAGFKFINKVDSTDARILFSNPAPGQRPRVFTFGTS
jgi:hypothetical protein